MARQPTIPASDYERIVALLAGEGYDAAQIRKVPHAGSPQQGSPLNRPLTAPKQEDARPE
jgi:hypothetical protein